MLCMQKTARAEVTTSIMIHRVLVENNDNEFHYISSYQTRDSLLSNNTQQLYDLGHQKLLR